VSSPGPLLDRADIQHAFTPAGERLVRRGVVADIYVIGGAAMALAYDARRSTRDIDAVFQPHGIVAEEARAVAGELGLPGAGEVTRFPGPCRRTLPAGLGQPGGRPAYPA
jgi:hypothetical protein